MLTRMLRHRICRAIFVYLYVVIMWCLDSGETYRSSGSCILEQRIGEGSDVRWQFRESCCCVHAVCSCISVFGGHLIYNFVLF
jgi:hypothetical protein